MIEELPPIQLDDPPPPLIPSGEFAPPQKKKGDGTPDFTPVDLSRYTVPAGPGLRLGGYTIDDDEIWLGWIHAACPWTKRDVGRAVREDAATQWVSSHVWNNAYYWAKLPTDGSFIWIFYWHNLSSSTVGWGAIQNSPNYWHVLWNDGEIVQIPDGKQVSARWKITSDQRIWLKVGNPHNENGFTADHICYGFCSVPMEQSQPW